MPMKKLVNDGNVNIPWEYPHYENPFIFVGVPMNISVVNTFSWQSSMYSHWLGGSNEVIVSIKELSSILFDTQLYMAHKLG